jgi:inward rectifier potassium channel
MTAAMPDDAAPNQTQTPIATVYPRMGGGEAMSVTLVGHGKDSWRDAYHYLLTMPLWRFLAVLATGYFAVNAVFGLAYYLVGGVVGVQPGSYADAFFFSVETMSTVGYGQLWPKSLPAHWIMALESFVGLLNVAIVTGLFFARFSRPTARVMFSDRAVVTALNGVPTLMLRAANRRRNRIVEAEVSVTLVRDTTTLEGTSLRSFETLETVRSRSPVFTLTWQIMHRIDEASPLYSESVESLKARQAEIVVIVRGLDETFAQTIHARGSYTPDEIVWGSRLADIFTRDAAGRPVIDYTHFHDIV